MLKKDFDFTITKQNTSDSDKEYVITGVASTYNKDLHGDIIMPGAFSESLSKRMPVLLYQHDQRQPIGISKCWETDEGIMLEGRLPKNDRLVKDHIIPQLEIGSLKGLSVGMSIDPDNIRYEAEEDAWLIGKADLWEVSLVTFPANTEALVNAPKSEMSCKAFLHSKGIVLDRDCDRLNSVLNDAIKEIGSCHA